MNTNIEFVIDCQKLIKSAVDVEEVRNIAEGYYGSVIFSLEKKEWDSFTEEQKNQFCEVVLKKFSKSI
ncbi:MAG: hypothetical protein ACYCZQ_03200 [Burkholderiales bacterium]